MNHSEMNAEREYLKQTTEIIDNHLVMINGKLERGILAANAATVEALTKLYISRLKSLITVKDKPYFARVDFTPDDLEPLKVYIGKGSVINPSGELVVIDWRAPISNLYYEGRVGQASYECEKGLINGEITLKRVFEIEKRELLSYSDVDITIDDELLKPYLSVDSETRIKNIISTIQTEQNRIIRNGINRVLMVQGAAGSGKTTIALHRIAYLLYTYEGKIKAEDILIFTPSELFLQYISGIFPDLGIEDIQQNTFESFALTVLNIKLKLRDPYDKLEEIISLGSGDDTVSSVSQFKSSLQFRDLLEAYLADLEQQLLPDEDLKILDYVFCSRKQLMTMFIENYEIHPWADRIKLMTNALKLMVGNQLDGLEKLIQDRIAQQVSRIPAELPAEEKARQKINIYDQYEDLLSDLRKGSGKALIGEYMKKIKIPHTVTCYNQLLRDPEMLRKYAGQQSPELLDLLSRRSRQMKTQMEYEDLAPLLYLHRHFKGAGKNIQAKHIVIDEAQDYSQFQLAEISAIFQCNMTILGDIAQGIYWYRGVSNWESTSQAIFPDKCDIVSLKTSYRSTVEVMEAANRVFDQMEDCAGIDRPVPVIRNGPEVQYLELQEREDVDQKVIDYLQQCVSQKDKTVAVVLKDENSCAAFYQKLQKHFPCQLLDRQNTLADGINVIPSYMTKGLEFDTVIIYDTEQYGKDCTSQKLLYVALTRSINKLAVCYREQKPDYLMS